MPPEGAPDGAPTVLSTVLSMDVPAARPLRRRPAARLLVIDARARLLLLCVEDAGFRIPRLWMTPGGGVHPGETFEQAAVRELWEETGIVAPLGPCVWTRCQIVQLGHEPLLVDERYFVVRVDAADVSLANATPWERETLTEHRWWTSEALVRTEEVVAPRCLPAVLPPILAGAYPPEPVAIGR